MFLRALKSQALFYLQDENEVTMNEGFLATVNEEGIMMVGEGRTIQVDENGW